MGIRSLPWILLAGGLLSAQDPFASQARVRVLLFLRSDCPITNRYAPELRRISQEFTGKGVEFWLVYPDPTETDAGIKTQIEQYNLPGIPLHDPRHQLAKRAEASVSPQAAVFDKAGRLMYTGRIDDRYVDFGKARQQPTTHDLEMAIAGTLEGKPIAEQKTHAIGCYLADVSAP